MGSWRSGSFFRYFGVLLFVFVFFLYYPRTLFGTLYFDDLTSFGPRKKSVDVFLAGLPKLREDIGDVFIGIDLVQPHRPGL